MIENILIKSGYRSSIYRGLLELFVGFVFTAAGAHFADKVPVQWTGFFCDDDEIRYPFKIDTITYEEMSVIYRILTVILVVICEYSCLWQFSHNNNKDFQPHFGGLFLRIVTNHLWLFLALLVGNNALTCLLNLAKRTTSRLRPNFIQVCQPVNLTLLCDENPSRFIEDYVCGQPIIDEEMLSFPSGHTAYCCFMSCFLVMYLHSRGRLPYFVKNYIQFFLVMLAVGISISRIRDDKHRLTDVIGGAVVGLTLAWFYVKMTLRDFYQLQVSFHDAGEDDDEGGLLEHCCMESKMELEYGIFQGASQAVGKL